MSDFKACEVAGWSAEGKALRYDALAGRLTRAVVEPLLDALDVRVNERFIDVATGPGHLAAAAAARGARAVGVDVSPDCSRSRASGTPTSSSSKATPSSCRSPTASSTRPRPPSSSITYRGRVG